MRLLLLVLAWLAFHAVASSQTDSLLRASTWQDTTGRELWRFTSDGTFQIDYGEKEEKRGRYLMGRYTVGEDGVILTLSVDYFLGKRRIPSRYRRGQDFYLGYRIGILDDVRLSLTDEITDEERTFIAVDDDDWQDPAERPIPKPAGLKLELPEGWGG